jgi:protein phosphatase 1G
VVVVYEEGREGGRLFVANAGDSRCVLSRGGKAIELSRDHKPEDEDEKARIEGAGGSVSDDGRVEGNLNLSRAIGDLTYKQKEGLPAERQMISACPEVRVEGVREGEDEFFVVACDGIWNVLSSQEVVDMVREGLREGGGEGGGAGGRISEVCEAICDRCCDREMGEESDGAGCDNMTMMVVLLPGGRGREGVEVVQAGGVGGKMELLLQQQEQKQEQQSCVSHLRERATSPLALMGGAGEE